MRANIQEYVALWRFDSMPIDLESPPDVPLPVAYGEEKASPLDNSTALGSLVELSLARLRDILEIELPALGQFGYDDIAQVARLHLSATEKILNTQVRVDDNVLKRRAVNTHAKLFRELLDHEERLPTLELTAAE